MVAGTQIARAFDRLERAAMDAAAHLRYFNEPDIQEVVGGVLDQIAEFRETHGQRPGASIADDCANLIGFIEQVDFDEDIEDRSVEDRQRLMRGYLGSILGALMAILRAAATLGLRPAMPEQALPDDARLSKEAYRDKLVTLAGRVDAVEALIRDEVEPEGVLGKPIVQTMLVTPYVAEMKSNLGVVGKLLRIGAWLDLAVLERAVSTIANATRDFVATIRAATSTATAALHQTTLNLRNGVYNLRRSSRLLIGDALRTETYAPADPMQNGFDLPKDYLEQTVHLISKGEHPPESWTPFITALDLRGRPCPDLHALSRLTALRILRINDPKLVELAPLSELTRLRILDLQGTAIVDLAPVVPLAGLVELRMANTKVQKLAPLGKLRMLEILDISYTPINDLSPLSGLVTLRALHASYSSIVDLTALRPLSNLEELDIGGTRVSDVAPLAGASALRTINLVKSAVADASTLGKLPYLRNIYSDPE